MLFSDLLRHESLSNSIFALIKEAWYKGNKSVKVFLVLHTQRLTHLNYFSSWCPCFSINLPVKQKKKKKKTIKKHQGFPGGSAGKESACNLGDLGSIPGLGGSPGEGNSYPLQYPGLEDSMDYIVHGVATFSGQKKKKKKFSTLTSGCFPDLTIKH